MTKGWKGAVAFMAFRGHGRWAYIGIDIFVSMLWPEV